MEEKERAQDMSKGQDKKEIMPNFLKDLNTEILEQLTALYRASAGMKQRKRWQTGCRGIQ